jgi:hypothetical protein
MDTDDVIEEGAVNIGGYSRHYCVKEDKDAPEEYPLQSLLYCVASSEGIQVYTMSELFDWGFVEMDFEVEEYCEMCESQKENCSTRLAHDLDKIELPLSELTEEPPTPVPEYICKECAYEIAELAEEWSEKHTEEIATRSL